MIITIVLVYLAIGVVFASALCYVTKDNSNIAPLMLLWPFIIMALLFACAVYILAKIGEAAEAFIERWILKRK